MPQVTVRRASYDYEPLKPVLFDIFDRYCGDLIGKNRSVIIKPNLLSPAEPDTAVLTHPMIVRIAAEYVISRGGRPYVSDSPAIGSFARIMKVSGIGAALKGLDVEYREFKYSTSADIGKPFGTIDLSEDAVHADVIINLAKLKTHSQMLLTLGIKNLFGTVVGLRKSEWHMRTGVDREMFARLLVQIYRTLKPTVTIVDGILAMEGNGPGKGGTPRHLGVILAGDDAVAVDMAVCWMLGIKAEDLLTNKAAKELGLCAEPIILDGDLPLFDDYTLPEVAPLTYGPPSTQSFLRRHLLQRPVVNDDLCTLCGECRTFCPAGAMSQHDKTLHVDLDRCIRCYCCIEVCPRGALTAQETLAGKILRRMIHTK